MMPKGHRKKRNQPTVGSIFERRFGEKAYRLKVVRDAEGIGYELSGRRFKTPTAAAKSVIGHDVNGWLFWKIDRTQK
jgi:hypothetical protein